jgi:hypothetical protein
MFAQRLETRAMMLPFVNPLCHDRKHLVYTNHNPLLVILSHMTSIIAFQSLSLESTFSVTSIDDSIADLLPDELVSPLESPSQEHI